MTMNATNMTTFIQWVLEVATPNPWKWHMQVLKVIAKGNFDFVTWFAGTWKTFILDDALWVLKSKYGEDVLFVIASTRLTTCGFGGTIVHYFVRIGVENETK